MSLVEKAENCFWPCDAGRTESKLITITLETLQNKSDCISIKIWLEGQGIQHATINMYLSLQLNTLKSLSCLVVRNLLH